GIVDHSRVRRTDPERSAVHHFRQRIEKAAIARDRLLGEIVELLDREAVYAFSYSRPDPVSLGIDAAEFKQDRTIGWLSERGVITRPLQDSFAKASPGIVGREPHSGGANARDWQRRQPFLAE